MNQSNSSKLVLLSVIGVAILVVAVVGVSFAFFNFTRTGPANTVRTGTIYFDTTYSAGTIQDLFPVAKTTAVTTATASVPSQVLVTEVKVSGYTTYTNGIDYEIKADTVNFNASYQNGASQVTTALPVSINVSSSGLGSETSSVAGAANATLARNANGIQTFDYEATVSNNTVTMTPVTNGAVLARGHIAANQDLRNNGGTDNRGTVYIRAYIDAAKLAISDTLAAGVSDGQTGSTAGRITVENYTNGTDSTWVAGRTVFTTEQWNSLNASGASFKIKIEANEGAAS